MWRATLRKSYVFICSQYIECLLFVYSTYSLLVDILLNIYFFLYNRAFENLWKSKIALKQAIATIFRWGLSVNSTASHTLSRYFPFDSSQIWVIQLTRWLPPCIFFLFQTFSFHFYSAKDEVDCIQTFSFSNLHNTILELSHQFVLSEWNLFSTEFSLFHFLYLKFLNLFAQR